MGCSVSAKRTGVNRYRFQDLISCFFSPIYICMELNFTKAYSISQMYSFVFYVLLVYVFVITFNWQSTFCTRLLNVQQRAHDLFCSEACRALHLLSVHCGCDAQSGARWPPVFSCWRNYSLKYRRGNTGTALFLGLQFCLIYLQSWAGWHGYVVGAMINLKIWQVSARKCTLGVGGGLRVGLWGMWPCCCTLNVGVAWNLVTCMDLAFKLLFHKTKLREHGLGMVP